MLPAIRSRLSRATASAAASRSRRILSTSTSVPKDPPFAYSSVQHDPFAAAAASSVQHDPFATAPPPPPPPPPSVSGSALSKFLKFTLFGAVTGAAAFTGYATYAYTLDEVDQKAKAIRTSANYEDVKDDASTIAKIQASVRSKAMKASAETIDLYLDLRRSIEERVREFTEPSSEKLLPELLPGMEHAYTLVLDLSETLVYSDWKRERGWRTFKRPGVDAFLEQLSQHYEIVVYSDQLSTYVDEILERLDEKRVIMHRLSRAATKYQDGKHYRDFSKLNRDPSRIIYVSGHALENALQPENGVQIKAWKPEDTNDTALLDIIPFLECVAASRPADIRQVLASYKGCDIAKEFLERKKESQRRMQEKKQRGGFIWQR